LSFLALAILLAVLRAAGTQIGWGFQLQSPLVVTALALLFFALALNLSGLFEFGVFVPSSLATKQLKNSYANSFLSGVLAAVIASPCTAPFMGAALGFALTQSAFAALVVFGALGVGMALPYVLLAWFPAWLRHLPKPGPWMQRLRALLAFPLYATVVWLTWVLALQVGVEGAVRLLALLVMVALAAWLYAQRGVAWRIAAACVIAAAGLLAWPLAADSDAPVPTHTADGRWEAFTPARVAELNAAGKPVFVDFTAAWCVTCQVNERLVLDSELVRDALAQRRVSLLRADWTRRDPMITQALADLGRNGVPVYVLYRPGRAPLVLPELLRQDIVLDALNTL
jgi:thiol:disulfide interchange protein DsbD